jgi:hypothetical protein
MPAESNRVGMQVRPNLAPQFIPGGYKYDTSRTISERTMQHDSIADLENCQQL